MFTIPFSVYSRCIPKGSTLVVGFSGGPDSMFLLHWLCALRESLQLTLIAAHLNHQWRIDSDVDLEFCRQAVAQMKNVIFVSHKATDLPLKFKLNGSQEELGRNMRRYFLEKIHKNYKADYIVLGHHAQDQQETFFIRMLRGATLTGLTAIKERQGIYVRPLLSANKADIIQYLDNNNIVYLTDPTNNSDIYLRNKIRKYVVPALKKSDARFDGNFQRMLQRLEQTELFLETFTRRIWTTIAQREDNTWFITIKYFNSTDEYIQDRLIMHWLILEQVTFVPTEKFIKEIKRFLSNSKSVSHQINNKWALCKKINRVCIVKGEIH